MELSLIKYIIGIVRYKLLLTSFLICVLPCSSAVFQGLDIKGDTLAFAQKGVVYLASIKESKILSSFIPKNDTILMDKILKKVLQDHSITGENRKHLKSSIRNMAITNLTWLNGKLVIGFHYYEGKFDVSSIRFLIIRYDLKLKSEGFCLLNSKDIFQCLNPYFPLEFRNDSTLFLSYYSDSNYIAEYRLNFKENSISKITNKKTNRLEDFTQHLSASVIMSQLPISIRNMGFALFIQFPFPVILNGTNSIVYDHNTSLRKLKDKKRIPNYSEGKYLDLEQKIVVDSSIYISSYSNRDSFWVLTTSKSKDKLQLLNFSKKQVKPLLNEYPYDSGFRYILDRRRIIGLSWENGLLKIKQIRF